MTATKQFIEDASGLIFDLLVKLENGKTMQRVRKIIRKEPSIFKKTMGEKQILFSSLSASELGEINTTFFQKRKEVCETQTMLCMWCRKLQHFYVKGIQSAVMRQALHAIEKTRQNSLEKKKTYHTTYTKNPTLEKECGLEKSDLQKRQFHMRPVWSHRYISGGRPLSSAILHDISS